MCCVLEKFTSRQISPLKKTIIIIDMFFTIIINITIVIIISIQHDLHQQPRCDKKTIATMASDLMFGGGK